jgi:hypothetical protein
VSVLEADSDSLLAAVKKLLAAKNLVSAVEIAARRAATDNANPGQGARMVARAWTDLEYRALMLADGAKAAEAMDIPMRGMPPLGVLENTDEVHNLVVCTLCSCYPRAVLGYPPYWYKSAAYRARAVRDPRGLLADPCDRLDGRLPLDGVAEAAHGHGRLECGPIGGDRARGRHGGSDGSHDLSRKTWDYNRLRGTANALDFLGQAPAAHRATSAKRRSERHSGAGSWPSDRTHIPKRTRAVIGESQPVKAFDFFLSGRGFHEGF